MTEKVISLGKLGNWQRKMKKEANQNIKKGEMHITNEKRLKRPGHGMLKYKGNERKGEG